LLNSDFEFTAGDPKSEAVNNAITCVSIKVEVRLVHTVYTVCSVVHIVSIVYVVYSV